MISDGDRSPKKILVISHSYYPLNEARAYRWTEISGEWVRQGHEVDVVCGKTSDSKELEEVEGVTVYRAYNPMAKLRPTNHHKATHSEKSSEKKVITGIKTCIKKVWKFFRWPDSECLWVFSAVKKVRALLREKKYDAVVSVSLPFSSHIVWKLAKIGISYSPVWICDIGDPFSIMKDTPLNNYRIYRRLNHIAEKNIVNSASAVTVTNPKITEEYLNIFQLDKSSVICIPPMLSINFDHLEGGKENNGMDTVKLRYFGALYKNIRDPSYLLEFLSKLKVNMRGVDIEMSFYGELEDCIDIINKYKMSGQEWVSANGHVARDQIPSMMVDADILINIGNRTSFQLPSKIVEYVASGKKILHVSLIEDDSVVKLLGDYPYFCNIHEKNEVDVNDINRVREFILNDDPVDQEIISNYSKPFLSSEISKQYIELINNKS